MRLDNAFADRLRSGQVCLGANVSFADPAVAELFAGAGLDFVWIDMEHAPLNIETVQVMMMAAEGGGGGGGRGGGGRGGGGGGGGRGAGRPPPPPCRYPPVGGRGYGPRRASN